jgi:uncharacterized protein YegP (UPF0339 family)
MPARFIIEPKYGYYGFHFISENENPLLFSRLFRTRNLCVNGVMELQNAARFPERFEKGNDDKGQYSFVVRNKKGITLGHSACFYASSTRDYAIKQLRSEAGTAVIIDIVERMHSPASAWVP